jgi:hypothetical protein
VHTYGFGLVFQLLIQARMAALSGEAAVVVALEQLGSDADEEPVDLDGLRERTLTNALALPYASGSRYCNSMLDAGTSDEQSYNDIASRC